MNDLYLSYILNRCLILYDNSMTINKVKLIILVVWNERGERGEREILKIILLVLR